LAGQQVSVTRNQFDTHVSAVTASGTTTLHVITGEGF
jgi:hypothetical protein